MRIRIYDKKTPFDVKLMNNFAAKTSVGAIRNSSPEYTYMLFLLGEMESASYYYKSPDDEVSYHEKIVLDCFSKDDATRFIEDLSDVIRKIKFSEHIPEDLGRKVSTQITLLADYVKQKNIRKIIRDERYFQKIMRTGYEKL